MEVEWKDPPPKNGRAGVDLREWLDELLAHPGRWAAREYATSSSASSSGQHIKHDPRFETTTRGAVLYARAIK